MAIGENELKLKYPLTKMSFVADFGSYGTAAFSEITGTDATVDVIEFRPGNANTLSLLKLPGLVKHGNVTMRFGITGDTDLIQWFYRCVDSERQKFERLDVTVTLIDTSDKVPTAEVDKTDAGGAEKGLRWILRDAWITKLTMPDLDAKTSDIAIASIEIAYERLDFESYKRS